MAQMGRPRRFNRAEAIEKAMLLFWEHGYESTSLSQLRVSMGGLSAASFYAAFESKESLFREVVKRYLDTHGQATAPLWDEALSPRAALEQALRNSARMQTEIGHPMGCLLVLAATTCSTENSHMQVLLAKERSRTRDGMRTCLERARKIAELPSTKDISALTTLFDTLLFGLTTQARDGTPLSTLELAITEAMTLMGGPCCPALTA